MFVFKFQVFNKSMEFCLFLDLYYYYHIYVQDVGEGRADEWRRILKIKLAKVVPLLLNYNHQSWEMSRSLDARCIDFYIGLSAEASQW